MSAEAVYDQLCENIRQYLKENPGDLLYGDGSDAADLNGNKLDSVYRSALQQGLVYHTQQNRGYLPAGLIEEIHALSRPSISWDVEETISTIHNYHKSTYRSVRIATDADLSQFVGSVQWVCQSPYRPGHKRKKWFLDFSSCTEAKTEAFDPKQVRFETFRSSGKGGQNVNKVETGVRAIYLPTWQVTVYTEERS